MDKKLQNLNLSLPQPEERYNTSDFDLNTVEGTRTFCNGTYTAFHYVDDNGDDDVARYWQVPKLFVFPKVSRRKGWDYWLLGMPNFKEIKPNGTTELHPIMPFRLMNPKLLPKKARSSLTVNWRPVFTIMDESVVSGDSLPSKMTSQEVEMWWNEGTNLLKSRVAYCFLRPRSHLWGVGTWSKAVQPSEISRNGTEEDKLALTAQPLGARNWTRKQRASHKRKRPPKAICLHGKRFPSGQTKSPASSKATPPVFQPNKRHCHIEMSDDDDTPPPPNINRPAQNTHPPLSKEQQQQLITYAMKYDSSISTIERASEKVLEHMTKRWLQDRSTPHPEPLGLMETLAVQFRDTQKVLSNAEEKETFIVSI